MKQINYSNSIVGIPNSILKYFGIEYFNSTSKVLDKYLNKYNPQNIYNMNPTEEHYNIARLGIIWK